MLDSTDKRSAALGFVSQTVGKAQAREDFFPLVDSLSAANSAVKITDHDRPVAVLMSYQNYVALTAKAFANVGLGEPKLPNLIGSIVINADLDVAAAELSSDFDAAIDESAIRD